MSQKHNIKRQNYEKRQDATLYAIASSTPNTNIEIHTILNTLSAFSS